MSTLPEKIDKQFAWQRTRYATSGDLMDPFVTVAHLAEYFATQMRDDPVWVGRRVKDELERRANAGEIRRWVDVHGPSLRRDRDDHYFIAP
jgi:hypothetical protein